MNEDDDNVLQNLDRKINSIKDVFRTNSKDLMDTKRLKQIAKTGEVRKKKKLKASKQPLGKLKTAQNSPRQAYNKEVSLNNSDMDVNDFIKNFKQVENQLKMERKKTNKMSNSRSKSVKKKPY